MPRASTIRTLADITEDQWGLFTRKQAEATGMAWTTLARLAKSGAAERVAHGVYRLRGGPREPNLDVRAAWMQLAPDVMVWDRGPEQGVLCRWSAAAVHGLSHPASGIYQFNLPERRQSRRPDVKLYKANLAAGEVVRIGGLLVTAPARIVADLIADGEDLKDIAAIAVDALHEAKTSRSVLGSAIAPHAARFGFAVLDGLSLLDWFLRLPPGPRQEPAVGAPELAAKSGGQNFLWINETERPAVDTDGTVVRLTSIVRQARSRRGAARSASNR